jgi:hypothetical protein
MVKRSDIARAGCILALAAAGVVARSYLDRTAALRDEAMRAEADLCKELADLDSTLHPMDTVTAETRVGSLKDANALADNQVRQLRRRALDLEDARLKELESALSLFRRSLELLPGGENVGFAAPRLAENLKAIRAAQARYHAPLDCGGKGSLAP